ncbi:tyrosine-type recombinase/integrase [Virgibacillus sp. L01]|uniref:tyrosine-type recombinase/integrase n=1 Tax=Virgibacillus sp. L01 TaxID=3457429 RepID=UPI003FD4F7D4
MGKESTNRKGKPIVKRRTSSQVFTDNSVNLSLEDALEYVYAFKQSEGMRQRTLDGYRLLFGYFTTWLGEHYPEVKHVNEISSGHIRQHVIYLSEEQLNQRTQEYGLSPYTVNIRIRLLKAFFTTLHKEEVIDKNPTATIKLMKVDEDNFEPLTEDEIDKLLKAPNVKEYA